MPGYLGGSSGSSGSGGEITFPKEFIDPVTKLRVSQPENLIDTDFEYGLQPTKWETVELINNTPSFFSKSGDTTIPGITSIATNNGTREITVTTSTDHGLAVGIPINVTGTKSVTADGSYVINSIPNTTTFTYLCKDEQIGNNAIEDLYSSIITGEFFQGSQIRIADAEGITTDAEAISTLTVKTDSTHGFGLNTPFYFLNLNSTISQEFEASNSAAKSFDSSNSATAQTFDGSNTLSTFNIDWSNSATVGGATSTISSVNTTADTITVTHGAETFANQTLATPLYYSLTVPASSGYFLDNPRGVVFLKTTTALNSPAGQSTFQVSATPDGPTIDITSSMSGTFQLANQARKFAGNNVNPANQVTISILNEPAYLFDGANDGGVLGHRICTVNSYSGSLVNVVSSIAGTALDYYTGAMVYYTTTGAAATGLTANTTYFIDSFFSTGGSNYAFTLKPLPTGTAITSISGGTGTQTFTRIGVSVDKDIVHIKNSAYVQGDLLEYTYPVGGKWTVADSQDNKNYFYVATAYDTHNYQLNARDAINAVGGTVTTPGDGFKYHTYSYTGADQTFQVLSGIGNIEVYMWGAGGGGATSSAWGYGGLGGGGGYSSGLVAVTAKTYGVRVGNIGRPTPNAGTVTYGGGGTTNGWDGGTNTGTSSGGGLAGLFDNNTYNQTNAILIAGGGGGGGGSRAGNANRGGAGGGTTGEDGTSAYQGYTYAGRGGTQTGGGAAGTTNQCGNTPMQAGQPLEGSGGNTGHTCYGGGGGAGYWGGSHGTYAEPNTMGGGGGGSGYAHPTKVTSAVLTAGSGDTPGNSGSTLRGGAGQGGNYNVTTAARVVIRYAV